MKNDNTTTLLVIAMLGLLAFAVVVGGILLALDEKSLPGELIAIGSAAAGSIASILARPGGTDNVRVINEPNEPVPVDGGGAA